MCKEWVMRNALRLILQTLPPKTYPVTTCKGGYCVIGIEEDRALDIRDKLGNFFYVDYKPIRNGYRFIVRGMI